MIGLSSGLVVRVLGDGAAGILTFLFYSILPVVVFFLLYAVRILGAGDIKLFSIISSFMGISFWLHASWFAFIIGAAVGAIKFLKAGTIRYRISKFSNYMIQQIQTKQLQPYKTDEDGKIHFSICILGGALLGLVLY